MGDSGDWEIWRIGEFGEILLRGNKEEPLGALENSGDWELQELRELREIREIREIGRLGSFGRLGKIVICGRSGKRCRGERMGCRRIGKSGAWEIKEIGRFGGLGGSGDWEIREIRGSRGFGRLGKISICGKN